MELQLTDSFLKLAQGSRNLATQLHIDKGECQRIVNGEQPPTQRFIAHAMRFGYAQYVADIVKKVD